MSSYCPQALYMTMNGVNYYYCQSCDSCSYVCVALNTVPDCGGCCPKCCLEPCNETVYSADAPIVELLRMQRIVTLPGQGTSIPNYVKPDTPYKRQYPGIYPDSDDLVTLVDSKSEPLCKLRILSFSVDMGDGAWFPINVGQQLDPGAKVGNNQVYELQPSSGYYHRVQYVDSGDNRQFDVITKDSISEGNLRASRTNADSTSRRTRGRRRGR